MFKRVKPKRLRDSGMRMIGQFPHCDQLILHAPGECMYCDKHPEWQELREAWGIAYTGYEPEAGEMPCPADNARPGGKCEAWPGNKARPNG
jgi:hypothetical protein